MSSDYLFSVANHLWQSTLVAALASVLALTLRNNSARIRYWIWFAATMKFLIPFSMLISMGHHFEWRTQPVGLQRSVTAVAEISMPFVAAPPPSMPPEPRVSPMPMALFVIWLCGLAASAALWVRSWLYVRRVLRSSSPIHLVELPVKDISVRVVSSASLMEPAAFGILTPVLVVPDGISDRMTTEQFQAILIHEMSHVHRRDNLTMTMHMLAETIFWFYPLLRWIGKRLIDERERACDEEVLRFVSEPQIYAEGILNICRAYCEAPAQCVTGVTGSDLKKRVRAILTGEIGAKLSLAKRIALAGVAIWAVALPVGLGMLHAHKISAQPQAAKTPLSFDVASVKQNNDGSLPAALRYTPSGIDFARVPITWVIGEAYQLPYYNRSAISATDDAVRGLLTASNGYDISARAEGAVSRNVIRLMLQSLLVERFKLRLHHESREESVYKLVLGKNGPRLHDSEDQSETVQPVISGIVGGFSFQHVEMARFTGFLSSIMDKRVVDSTGLKGFYDVELKLQEGPQGPEDKNTLAVTSAILAGIESQLGLKLESARAPVDHVVIDHLEKPNEN